MMSFTTSVPARRQLAKIKEGIERGCRTPMSQRSAGRLRGVAVPQGIGLR
jgi:hypothetical protein